MSAARLDALEREIAVLRRRIDALERERRASDERAPLRNPLAPAVEQVRVSAVDIEELLGGRLLALAGAIAFLLGIAFFVALAIDRGWIGVTARVVLAALASTALFAGGASLYERRGRSQAALAMAGAGIAALYLTLTAATAGYALIPDALGLAAAVAIGTVATATAVRWSSRTVAGIGILGALLAPALTGSFTTGGMAFLAVAFAAATGVLLRQRWSWLGVGAFAVAVCELAIYVLEPGGSQLAMLVFVAVFSMLNLAAALGHDLRTRSTQLEPAAGFLAVFGALTLGALGYVALPHDAGQLGGGVWLAALALAYGTLGVVAVRAPHASDEVALTLLTAGLGLGDAALGLLANGVALPVAWAASAALVAAAGTRLPMRAEPLRFALGAQLALAIGHALLFEAAPTLVWHGHGRGPAAVSALAAVAVGAFAAARLALDEPREWRFALDGVALAGLAYADAFAFDGAALVVAWALAAGALAETARRTGDELARAGALGFVGLAAGHVVLVEAPPSALVESAADLSAAATGLAATATAAFAVAERCCAGRARRALRAGAGGAAVYLASIAVVTWLPAQQAQVVVSGLWSLFGLATLWMGLRRDERELRLGGFALLVLSLAKVFLYDLAALASIYRVLSLVAVGLLLLLGALAYQRIRLHPPTALSGG